MAGISQEVNSAVLHMTFVHLILSNTNNLSCFQWQTKMRTAQALNNLGEPQAAVLHPRTRVSQLTTFHS